LQKDSLHRNGVLDLLDERGACLSDPHTLTSVDTAGTEAGTVAHEKVVTEHTAWHVSYDETLARLFVLELALTTTPHAVAGNLGDDDVELNHFEGTFINCGKGFQFFQWKKGLLWTHF